MTPSLRELKERNYQCYMSHERIAAEAYRLWELGGCQEGRDKWYWFVAKYNCEIVFDFDMEILSDLLNAMEPVVWTRSPFVEEPSPRRGG